MLTLQSLSYSHFLLFKNLQLQFDSGLTVISGESGSGKSLFLEGIELLMGKRLEQSVFSALDTKAILEAKWSGVQQLKSLINLCEKMDVDLPDDELIVRREILPSGKNRCFVNDTPVKAADLSLLGSLMAELVTQHHTSSIKDKTFQLHLIDSLAQNQSLKSRFQDTFKTYKTQVKILEQLTEQKKERAQQQDYLQFRFQELEDANLTNPQEEEELEHEHQILANAAEILSSAQAVQYAFHSHEQSIDSALSDMGQQFKNLASLSERFNEDLRRFQNVRVEFDDLIRDLDRKSGSISIDEQKMHELEDRMSLIQDLKRKHQAQSIQELMHIHESLQEQLRSSSDLDSQIEEIQKQVVELKQELQKWGNELHQRRSQNLESFCLSLKEMLRNLEIPHAQVEVVLNMLDFNDWTPNGPDAIQMMFSANPGMEPAPLEKIASGGEMSRLMLCFKTLGRNLNKLIVFDEIDTGVSGQVAMKMGEMIAHISLSNQVFVITHLAQVASRSNHHFLIRKDTQNNESVSLVEPLNHNQKIAEVARMLSGKEPGLKAIENAKELINKLAPPPL